jgi:hypothetical protein
MTVGVIVPAPGADRIDAAAIDLAVADTNAHHQLPFRVRTRQIAARDVAGLRKLGHDPTVLAAIAVGGPASSRAAAVALQGSGTLLVSTDALVTQLPASRRPAVRSMAARPGVEGRLVGRWLAARHAPRVALVADDADDFVTAASAAARRAGSRVAVVPAARADRHRAISEVNPATVVVDVRDVSRRAAVLRELSHLPRRPQVVVHVRAGEFATASDPRSGTLLACACFDVEADPTTARGLRAFVHVMQGHADPLATTAYDAAKAVLYAIGLASARDDITRSAVADLVGDPAFGGIAGEVAFDRTGQLMAGNTIEYLYRTAAGGPRVVRRLMGGA